MFIDTEYAALMQVKNITECSKLSNLEHSAILSTFIKLPFVIKTFVLSIFEWPFYTSFAVFCKGIASIKKYNKNVSVSVFPSECR